MENGPDVSVIRSPDIDFLLDGRDPYVRELALPNGPPAAFICHDLRHPLTAILAYSELLAEENLNRSQRKDFYNEIRLAVCRMNDLISLLSGFSKSPATPQSELVDIVDTVKRAIRTVAVKTEFRRIDIHDHHEGSTKAWFAPGLMHQVITNLVLNACEAVSPDSGRVHVRSLGRHDCVEISISDNGPGIPEPIRQAVFQPFVTYGKRGGMGLGLAIVQKILRDQGGDIYLDSTGEEGTVFRIVLPFVGPQRCHHLETREIGEDTVEVTR